MPPVTTQNPQGTVQGQPQAQPQQPQVQQPQGQSPTINATFKPPTPTSLNQFWSKGSLIVFKYSFWMHDPYPLVIVSSSEQGNRISGVNLHYLTYPVISALLSATLISKTFSWQNYKNNPYISGAFRTYKWNGITQVKKLDCDVLLKVISGVRSVDPSQVQAIRQSVEDQLRRQTNPTLEQDTNKGIVPTVGQVPVVGQQNNNTQANVNQGTLNGG